MQDFKDQFGPEELHALIQNAQYALWDTDEQGVELPFCKVRLDTKAILHRFFQLLPTGEAGNHYRQCQTCHRSILEAGNWVIVNFDGTLDSVLFPAADIPNEFRNEWFTLLQEMNTFITHQVTEEDMTENTPSRVIQSTVCRPLDGAAFPKAVRNDERHHFSVFSTPRQLESARTLCKANSRMFQQALAIVGSAGFNSTNIAGLLALPAEDYTFSEPVFKALNSTSIVLWNVDTYGVTEERRLNILGIACGFDEGLARFPVQLIPALDAFETSGDYDKLLHALRILKL